MQVFSFYCWKHPLGSSRRKLVNDAMASPPPKAEPSQLLHDEAEGLDADVSLIQPGRVSQDHNRNGYYSADPFGGSNENPYRDTTESDSNLRHIPLSEVIPPPWQSYQQIQIASYISVVLFFPSGLFAVKYALRGRQHQSRGIMGMAQRDLRLATRLIYVSFALGILLWFIIIPVAASWTCHSPTTALSILKLTPVVRKLKISSGVVLPLNCLHLHS